MSEPTFFLLAGLFVVGIGTGIISAISGGAGLLITPLFLFLGLSPIQTIATQNLYSFPSQASAAWYFWRQGHLPRVILRALPLVFLFGGIGAVALGLLPDRVLKIFIPILLIGLAVWVAFNPTLQSTQNKPRLSFRHYGLLVLPFLAFYDGFFGACSTTFYTLSYLTLLNRKIVEATATAKVFSATSSLAALGFFVLNGNIVWGPGLAIAAGGVIGARVGSALVVKHGAPLVRWLIVGTSLAASTKLLGAQFFILMG